jgi:hemoglobin
VTQALFDRIGGEAGLHALVHRFYDILEFSPEGERLRQLHFRGHGFAHARIEQVDFLSGFLGGPRIYAERHGHMDLRLIHAHVPISAEAAEDWLAAMDRALAENRLAGPDIDRLRATFRRICMMLVNDLEDWGQRPARPE